MGAPLDDLALVQDDDLVGVADRRQPVGDRERRPPLGEALELGLHGVLGLGVKRAGGLVEHEHRRVAQHRAGDRHALLLTARESVTPLADDRVIAVGQRRDQGVDAGGARRVLDLLVGRLGTGEAQVVADAGVEEVRLLGDHADGGRQRGQRRVAHVDAVDRHPALLGLVEPRDQISERGLARPGLPDDRRPRARRYVEVDVAQRPRVLRAGAVAEGDVLEADLAQDLVGPQLDRMLGLDDVHRQIEVLEDAVKQGQRRLDVGAHPEQ